MEVGSFVRNDKMFWSCNCGASNLDEKAGCRNDSCSVCFGMRDTAERDLR